MECVSCGGNGCNECDNTGRFRITDCPLKDVTAEVRQLIRLAELFEKGLPPVAGGVLDQGQNFIEAAEFVFSEEAYWKAKLGAE